MLRIYTSSKELRFDKLMPLYFQDFADAGPAFFQAEQDFYSYLLEFLKQENSFYAVWEINGVYTSALRIEPYQDGVLLEGLVTNISLRNRGLAKALICQTLNYLDTLGQTTVYSHIRKDNIASLRTHTACGFLPLLDYAKFIDGSVDHGCITCVYKK